jgi:hypothetical protein
LREFQPGWPIADFYFIDADYASRHAIADFRHAAGFRCWLADMMSRFAIIAGMPLIATLELIIALRHSHRQAG